MIPISLVESVAIASMFCIVCSYVLVFGFQGSHQHVADTANILATISQIAGVSGFGYLLDLGVIPSMFSVFVAA